jgi:DNA-binding transcriptional LysR family regulator
MDLLQLEHFVAVYEERTFTRAAERVFRTQSAVSQSIKRLEDEIGSALFVRGDDLTLTDAGKVLLECAHRMLGIRNEATRQLEALRNLTAGSLSVGAHEAAALYLLPLALHRFFRLFPNVKVGIYRARPDEVPTQVLDHQIDLGFTKEDCALRGLKAVEVHSDEMVLIAAPEHPLATRRIVRVRDLGSESFVLHHQCTSTMQKIIRLFEQNSTPCRVAAELWSFENIKGFVIEGFALGIVPRVTARRETKNKLLVEIPVQGLDIRRRTLMVYRDQGYVSEPARQFIMLVKKLHDAYDDAHAA